MVNSVPLISMFLCVQELLAARTKLMEDLAEVKSDKLSNSQEIEVNIYLDELKVI